MRTAATTGDAAARRRSRQVLLGVTFGNILQAYDFFIYATASALVFNELFFPQFDPLVGTIAAFAVWGVGNIAKPLGGIVLGNLGDRIGRKPVIMISLAVMGVSTFLVGLLPVYADVGLLAPILLLVLRLVQGFSVGGEWGGASTLVTESAPPHRRGLFSGFIQSGISGGFLLSALVMHLVTLLPRDQFLSWGWRVPFLAGVIVAIVGLIIRRSVDETEAFSELKEQQKQERLPALRVLRTQYRAVLITVGLVLAENSSAYVIATFGIVYATTVADVSGEVALNALMIATVVQILMMNVWGALSDRIGRRPVYASGVVLLVLFSFPFFWMLDTGSPTVVYLAMIIAFGLIYPATTATQPCFFSELFPTDVRQSGASMGHEIGSVFAGGVSPLIATSLLYWTGGSWAVSIYLVIIGSITLVALWFAAETRDRDLKKDYSKRAKSSGAGDRRRSLGTTTE